MLDNFLSDLIHQIAEEAEAVLPRGSTFYRYSHSGEFSFYRRAQGQVWMYESLPHVTALGVIRSGWKKSDFSKKKVVSSKPTKKQVQWSGFMPLILAPEGTYVKRVSSYRSSNYYEEEDLLSYGVVQRDGSFKKLLGRARSGGSETFLLWEKPSVKVDVRAGRDVHINPKNRRDFLDFCLKEKVTGVGDYMTVAQRLNEYFESRSSLFQRTTPSADYYDESRWSWDEETQELQFR